MPIVNVLNQLNLAGWNIEGVARAVRRKPVQMLSFDAALIAITHTYSCVALQPDKHGYKQICCI